MWNFLSKTLLLTTLALSVTAQTLNIIGTLAFTPQFSAFNNLAFPITNELNTTGPITVFAPTNLAVQQFFQSLPAGFNISDSPGLGRSILLYHVAPGYFLLENITNSSPLQTLNGNSLTFARVGGSITVNNEAVLLSQFPVVNGNIFQINKVLIPPGVTFPTPSSAPVATSAGTVATSAIVETTVPVTPQAVGICTDQFCCTARAFPNVLTGDGYLEFTTICNNGGLHCDDNTGCLLCHDPNINLNIFNRPLCNVSTVQPYTPCSDQPCCTAKMSPNAATGYGYLAFNPACANGGLNCFGETGCEDCYNPIPGTLNVLNIPQCSPEAIQSFGNIPVTSQVATAASTAATSAASTAATTVLITAESTVELTAETTAETTVETTA